MSLPSVNSSASFETLGHIQDSINTSFTETQMQTSQPNETPNMFKLADIVKPKVIHNRSSSVTSKKGVPNLNLRDILAENNRLSSGNAKHSQGVKYHGSQPQNLNQTAPLHKHFEALRGSSSNVEELQEQILFLEEQNAKYVEKMARMENELALAYSLRTYSNEQDSANFESQDDEGKMKAPKRIKELELQNIKLVENNEYLSEKLNQMEIEYNQMKSYMDINLEQYERLYSIVQDNEDNKENLSRHAKSLNDSLKSLNHNYIALQKKVASLEKENKEITAALKNSEAEKKSISEKWQKLSKKVRAEGEFQKTTKNLEEEVRKYQKEVCEYKEKFLSKDAQVRNLREDERNYKALIENNAETIQNIKKQLDLQSHKNNILTNKNSELAQQLTELQTHQQNYQSTSKQDVKAQDNSSETRGSMASLETQLQTLEAENYETLNKLAISTREIEHLAQEKKKLEESCQALKGELDYANKKWLLLVRDHDQLQKDHRKLVVEQQDENILTEALQKINNPDDNVSDSTTRRESGYDELKDPYAGALIDELLKVKSVSRELYDNIERCLNMHFRYVTETTVSKEVEEKYNRLLVKYYKALDKTQALEKQLKEYPKKIDPSNHVNVNLNTLTSNTLSSLQKNEPNIQRSNLHDKLTKNLNNSMSFGKPAQNLTAQDPNLFIRTEKHYFQPLQKSILNNRTPSENQKERPSVDSSKENMTPNQGSKRGTPSFKANMSNKMPIHLMDAQTHDLRKQLLSSKVLRSSSNGRSVKDEGRSQGQWALSSNDTSTGQSLGNSFNLNISDILKDGENLRKRNYINERTNSSKNKSYLDLHLSRKSQNQPGSNMNNSFSFVSNF